MDLSVCAGILQSRETQGCEMCPTPPAPILAQYCPPCQSAEQVDSSIALFESTSNLDLLILFTKLQGERVQTYIAFDAALDQLIEQGTIAQYPHLCAEATSIFLVLSKKIRAIKVCFFE